MIIILKAEVIPDKPYSYESPIINIESNPSVFNTLRKYKFFKIQKELLDMETSSDCSENSLIYISNLQKLALEENILPAIEEESEKEIEENLINPNKTEPPIGFGEKSCKKAEIFASKRFIENNEKEDVMHLIQPTTSEDVMKIVHEDKPKSSSNISISYDIGIDIFPQYALEYLKHKYNIVN